MVNFVEDTTAALAEEDGEGISIDEALGLKNLESNEMEQVLEPPTKRLKRDLAKETEEELPTYNELIENSKITSTEKFKMISGYLNSIFEKNVNTLQFEVDFNDWTKQKLLLLMEEMAVTSVEFYQFLCNILNVTPTIFEGVCEKILSAIYQRHTPSLENDQALEIFMEKLSNTFEKLHRYPKLIAKLMCCARENIQNIVETVCSKDSKKAKKRKSLKSKTTEEIVSFILPPLFMKSFCSALNLLPFGQIIDLGKTLDHNFSEECVKKLEQKSGTPDTLLPIFLTTIVKLIESFLLNIKVADYSVPGTTVERVAEMMNKFRDVSLPELGRFAISIKKVEYIQPFLRASYAWGTLHEFLLIYNTKYMTTLPDPTTRIQKPEDLSYLFPYLSEEAWVSLWNLTGKNEDTQSRHLLVSLVALKLKCLAVIDQQRKEIIEESSLSIQLNCGVGANEGIKIMSEENGDPDNLTKSIKAAAQFVWTQQHLFQRVINDSNGDIIDDLLDLASSYMDFEELIEYAKAYLSRILLPLEDKDDTKMQGMHSITNIKFQVALILESLHEGLRRAEKANLMKPSLKKFSQEFMNPQCKKKILEDLDRCKGKSQASEDIKNYLQLAIQIVNESIGGKMVSEAKHGSHECVPDLLKDIICYIDHQALSRYPKTIKTIIFLSCALILTALLEHEEYHEAVVNLVSILSECGRNAQGNEFLFQVNWTGLFGLLTKNEEIYGDAGEQLCGLILENIYISPKIAKDFGETYVDMVSEKFELSKESFNGSLSISMLEFVMQELIDGKSKSTSLLQSHAKKLANTAVSKLSDGSIIAELHSLIHAMKKQKKKGKSEDSATKKIKLANSSFPFVSRVMQTCNLLLKGKSFMSVEDASEYNVIVLPYMHFALDFLEVCEKKMSKTGGCENMMCDANDNTMMALSNCLQFLIECVKSFEEFRAKLAQDFLSRLWHSCALEGEVATVSSKKETGCMNTNFGGGGKGRVAQKGILRLILEVANETEFQTICDSTVEKMGNETELPLVAHILSNLVDAEIKADDVKKKQIRRTTVELSLYKCLEQLNLWKESDDFIRLSMPYVHFQTALLRRRKPMCNLNALAVCLSSVTAVPLDKIKDVETFKTVFLSVGDLLNALAFHRIDVLSFRTHIFLQCFQSVVESLVKRADQKNKLTDREINDLRQCGHCIERICQSAKLGKHEFARVSPYLIVVLLQLFDKTTVYPVVKNPLLSGCYKLLDMCDEHGISHVNSMLSKGSREVFKAVYDVYNKFYRYKGKV